MNVMLPTVESAQRTPAPPDCLGRPRKLTHLEEPECESIHVIRESVAESDRPVLLYSVGKGSSVLLHLAIRL
jgi:sulfate adenylyltransferase subunit 2